MLILKFAGVERVNLSMYAWNRPIRTRIKVDVLAGLKCRKPQAQQVHCSANRLQCTGKSFYYKSIHWMFSNSF